MVGQIAVSLGPIVTEFTPGLSVHTGAGVIAYVLLLAPDVDSSAS
jgi:hypothetical protein